jgi:hypothetical protein
LELANIPIPAIDPRPWLKAFAGNMEAQLQAKDSQYGVDAFLTSSYISLAAEAGKHLAIATGDALLLKDYEGVRKHCAHAANFLGFIATKALIDAANAEDEVLANLQGESVPEPPADVVAASKDALAAAEAEAPAAAVDPTTTSTPSTDTAASSMTEAAPAATDAAKPSDDQGSFSSTPPAAAPDETTQGPGGSL